MVHYIPKLAWTMNEEKSILFEMHCSRCLQWRQRSSFPAIAFLTTSYIACTQALHWVHERSHVGMITFLLFTLIKAVYFLPFPAIYGAWPWI